MRAFNVGSGHPPPPANENHITRAFVCGRCQAERPATVTLGEYAQLVVGLTPDGIQVWCERHDGNVVHLRATIQNVDATCAKSSRSATSVLLDKTGEPIEATPAQLEKIATEIADAARSIESVPFGAAIAAVKDRPGLAPLLAPLYAASALVARCDEWRRASELAELRRHAVKEKKS